MSQDPQLEKLLTKLRKSLVSRGADGIRGLGRHFKICDKAAPFGVLDRDEFTFCMKLNKLSLDDSTVSLLMSHFDRNGDGISYAEFLRAVRGRLSSPRRKSVMQVFHALDQLTPGGERGYITIASISPIYSTSRHPAVIAGKKTKDEVLQEFLNGFEGTEGDRDGRVTLEEWITYYEEVSCNIDSDAYFVDMMDKCWARLKDRKPQARPASAEGHPYTEGRVASGQSEKAQVDRLSEALRKSITSKVSHGTVTQIKRFTEKAFREWDQDGAGTVSMAEFVQALERFGLHTSGAGRAGAGGISMQIAGALFNRYDTDGSGVISYSEFCDQLFAEDLKYEPPPTMPKVHVSKPTFAANQWIKEGTLDVFPSQRPSSGRAAPRRRP